MPKLRSLTDLQLSNCGLDGRLAGIATSLHAAKLQKLNLMGNKVGEDAQALGELLTHLVGLTELNLSYCNLDGAGLGCLDAGLRSLTHLEALHLRNNKLASAGAAVLSGTVGQLQRLRRLDVRLCQLGAEDAAGLAPTLSQLSSLEALEFGDHALTVAFVCALDGTTRLYSLRHLRLERAGIDEGLMQRFAQGLAHLQDLQVLSLCNNSFGLRGAKALGAALGSLQKLRELHLSTCVLDEACMKELYPAIGQLLDLESLNVMGNEVVTEGAKQLSVVLLRLLFLRELNLMACNLSAEGKELIEASVGPGVTLVG